MHHIGYRLTDNTDPEERLEEAALWKAMRDHYGDRISAVMPGDHGGEDWIMFGRVPHLAAGREPVSARLDYWEDPAFLDNCGREFRVVPWEGAREAVADLHFRGVGAFIKSTRSKHFVAPIPVGHDVDDVIGDMAFSFMDGGPSLMVQALADVAWEYRFFVMGREIVAESPVMVDLTPIDHGKVTGQIFQTPTSRNFITDGELIARFRGLAEMVAETMVPDHVVIDVALVDGRPAVIEMNPMRLGQVGLYASDVRALAAGSEKLIRGFIPKWRPAFVVRHDDEEDFVDDAPSYQG
ncbi:hypothetical protein G6L37_02060 [Agrobacterium rubi]|nr:hypothetical protein [Agrobacterium rubi]NTF24178.1 hypothetical protein [Agrobacterium rubi]